MIELSRTERGPLRIGHRGAAALAPENTIRAFEAAMAAGVDLVEFDVLDLPRGPLVVAHSDDLEEVSHGRARGSVRARTLAELREVAPELPTLDEALAFFADQPLVGVHVDLKLATRLDELAAAVSRFGLERRTVVSAFHTRRLHEVARYGPGIRIGFTYPEDRMSISRRPHLWPLVALGLSALRASVPVRLPRLVHRAGATVVMLQHRLVTEGTVARAHHLGVPVLAWTVDDPVELVRVVEAGVDGVITNDPTLFARVGL